MIHRHVVIFYQQQRRCLSSIEKRLLEVVLVGRPNTGKSTLFNRLVGSKLSPQAIVSPVSGTTRDRRQGQGQISGLVFNLVDTGGLDDRGIVNKQIQHQVMSAMEKADILLFLLDAQVGVTHLDKHFARWLRRTMGIMEKTIFENNNNISIGEKDENKRRKKEIFLLANKTEGAHLSDRVLDTVSEGLEMGFGEPLLISASHGDGIADLAQALIGVAKTLGLDTDESEVSKRKEFPLLKEDKVIQLAIMGKPNVGKSTLLNAIVQQDRVITGPTPGLTRDAIHVDWRHNGRLFRLVDTAGLTRITPLCKTNSVESSQLLREDKKNMDRIGRNLEVRLNDSKLASQISLPGVQETDPLDDPSQYSYQISELALTDALNSLRFAQVVLLVIEAKHGKFAKIDLQLAERCLSEGRALVVCANKRDTVLETGVNAEQYEEGVILHCRQYMKDFGEVRVVSCAAAKNDGVSRVLDVVQDVHDNWSKRIDTWVINKWLKDTMITQPQPRVGGKGITIKFITQIKTRPPTFALFCNSEKLPGFYERFLRSKLQSDYKLEGVPVRFVVRKSAGNPVRKSLLQKGHARRGVGRKETRGVGPNRDKKNMMGKRKSAVERDQRRRRDTRRRRTKSYTSKTKY